MEQIGYTSRAESIAQFLTVVLVFLLVVALTYFTTKFVGGFQKRSFASRNFDAIETYRITNGKYLQIVRVGSKYVVIGISKDNITSICELSEDDIVFSQKDGDILSSQTFKACMEKAFEHIGKGGNKNDK